MEGQGKGSRGLGAYCKGGKGPLRAVAPSKKKEEEEEEETSRRNELYKMWDNLKNGIYLCFSFRKKYILRLKNEGLSAVMPCRFVSTA